MKLYQHHEITLVTARPVEKKILTKQWLSKNDIPYHNLIFLSEGTKHEIEENFDVIIDDHLEEIINWIGKVSLVLVYNYP